MTGTRPSVCEHDPSGERAAALVLGLLPSAEETEFLAHAASCDACAANVESLGWTAAVAARRPGAVRRRRSRAILRRCAAAALVIAALWTTGALSWTWRGVVRWFRPSDAIGTSPTTAARIASLDLAAIGIDPETARIRALDALALPADRGGGPLGTVAVVRSNASPEPSVTLAAFDASGSPLWWSGDGTAVASWRSLVRNWHFDTPQVRTLVAAWRGGPTRTLGVVTVEGARGAALLLFDPQDGRERGVVWNAGPLAADSDLPSDAQSPLPLPAGTGEPRTFLAVGALLGEGTSTTPCALVFDADGRVLQRVRFPVTGARPEGGRRATGARAVWSEDPDADQVSVFTSEEIEWRIPVVAGRLDAGRARAAKTDAFVELFDRTAGRGEFRAAYPGPDAVARFLADLARGVEVDESPSNEAQW